ncbi:MAG: hypothetical protein M1825_006167 [Sarcosagium campestre]|nr:MAG: hypothetical protein M1825_006167 [Sarcosagium campestre]
MAGFAFLTLLAFIFSTTFSEFVRGAKSVGSGNNVAVFPRQAPNDTLISTPISSSTTQAIMSPTIGNLPQSVNYTSGVVPTSIVTANGTVSPPFVTSISTSSSAVFNFTHSGHLPTVLLTASGTPNEIPGFLSTATAYVGVGPSNSAAASAIQSNTETSPSATPTTQSAAAPQTHRLGVGSLMVLLAIAILTSSAI